MSWSVRYSVNGRDRRLTVGPYPGIGLADARKKAVATIGQVAAGTDPAAEKVATKEAARAAMNARPANSELVENVVAEFIARYAKPNLRTWPELQRKFEKDVLPLWGRRRLADIGKADVHRLLDQINDRRLRPYPPTALLLPCAECAAGRSSAASSDRTVLTEGLAPYKGRSP